MEKITLSDLEKVLYDFVKRAASKEATPEEVAVLLEVARVLAEMLIPYFLEATRKDLK